jgi:transketolase
LTSCIVEFRVLRRRRREALGVEPSPGYLGWYVDTAYECQDQVTHTRHIATHDSIGLGEDGPTHQPIETAVHLRAIPNLAFWRPADGNETSAAYLVAIQSSHTPSVLSLSRQNLPNLEGSTIENASKGGYVLYEEQNEDLTIVSTGSEVSIALAAAGKLKAQGIKTRVVSLPCWLVFDQQPEQYRLSVLRSGAPILSLEALSVRRNFNNM